MGRTCRPNFFYQNTTRAAVLFSKQPILRDPKSDLQQIFDALRKEQPFVAKSQNPENCIDMLQL